MLGIMGLMGSCRSQQEVAPAVSAMSMECVALEQSPSGELAIRAWGSGTDRKDAIKKAMRNALSEILFKGIKAGPARQSVEYPLLPEVNAKERHAGYFDSFFSSKGDYRRFVKEEDKGSKVLKSTGVTRDGYSVVVLVNLPALREHLRKDGLIK